MKLNKHLKYFFIGMFSWLTVDSCAIVVKNISTFLLQYFQLNVHVTFIMVQLLILGSVMILTWTRLTNIFNTIENLNRIIIRTLLYFCVFEIVKYLSYMTVPLLITNSNHNSIKFIADIQKHSPYKVIQLGVNYVKIILVGMTIYFFALKQKRINGKCPAPNRQKHNILKFSELLFKFVTIRLKNLNLITCKSFYRIIKHERSMNNIMLAFLLTIIVSSSYSQFRDIIPLPNSEYQPNSNLNLDKVKVLKIYKNEYKKGKKKRNRQLVYEQHLDSLGNTTLVIENEVDTTTLADFVRLRNYNIVTYDSLNRPIKEISGNETKYWAYENDKLIEFRLEIQSIIIEKRTYLYSDNRLNYSDCFYSDDINGKCHEMVAFLNEQNNPIKTISTYELNQKKVSDTCTYKYDDSGNCLEEIFDGRRKIYKYSDSNYRTQFLLYDSNGILIYSEEYEYEMY